jgi:hypothetical protein
MAIPGVELVCFRRMRFPIFAISKRAPSIQGFSREPIDLKRIDRRINRKKLRNARPQKLRGDDVTGVDLAVLIDKLKVVRN